MKMSDLSYITQENLDKAHINITSAEMYAEAREFNLHMLRMQRKKLLFYADYWGMFLMNAVLVPIVVMFSLASEQTMIISTGAPLWISFVLPVIFWLMYSYFIFFRKLYDWRVILGISLILLPAGYPFIITAAANALITHFIRKIDTELRDEVGYPHFVELKHTFIRPEQEEEEKKENPYSTYISPPEDDSSFLFNNDISLPAESDNN